MGDREGEWLDRESRDGERRWKGEIERGRGRDWEINEKWLTRESCERRRESVEEREREFERRREFETKRWRNGIVRAMRATERGQKSREDYETRLSDWRERKRGRGVR